ncbi:MAG: glycerol kinase GlpK [Acidobacteriia bacterium]|nr:glycerol kinase GlpK [Terriglobia bacterium]
MTTSKRFILALDQGTTSSRAILFDHDSNLVSISQREVQQIYPRSGWVEHDPEEIWQSQLLTAREVLDQSGVSAKEIAAIGITNQRETSIVWERATGRPIHNAIVWQCRRTAELCDELKEEGFDRKILKKTGLVTDAYFSGTKIRWMLDHIPGARARARDGELLFGTVDSWLIYKLTQGGVHATDYSNASRTLLFDIHRKRWDQEILNRLEIPKIMLPRVLPSSGVFGEAASEWFGTAIPIAGNAGDQQAALYGQACFEVGMVKNTYGTGCFLLLNTGERAVSSKNGLLTTIGWGMKFSGPRKSPGRGAAPGRRGDADDVITYALEGSVFIAGAAIQWLRDGLKIIDQASQSETLATSVKDSGGVYFVPAFVGLGAPYWDMQARGTLVGITRGTERAHIVRAALESMAFQTRDVAEAMQRDAGTRIGELRVDGGAVANNFLCQFQADILGVPVLRPSITETTALGAAYLAGLAVDFWKNQKEISSHWKLDRKFEPRLRPTVREAAYAEWKRAVERSLRWKN